MRTKTIVDFFSRLQQANPEPLTELTYRNEFTLLVAIVFSAQSTDVGVNKATQELFILADTPQKMLDVGEEGLKKYIRTLGLFNSKAKKYHCAMPHVIGRARRPGARDARGVGEIARRWSQNGQCLAELRPGRRNIRGGYARVPRL